jgi:hypothetical protein
VRPIAHINLERAQAWQRIPNNASCFEAMPKEFGSLARQWQSFWKAVETI